MKIAYLVNQYPKVSHSFIRREIQALEQLGVAIGRYSIRPIPDKDLVDPEDSAERDKTTALLAARIPLLGLTVLRTLISVPLRFLKGLTIATRLGSRSQRGILRHWAYLAEACLLKENLALPQNLWVDFRTWRPEQLSG
jgi:colanic acid/amylovoran biosynthesis glycosyltransferase